MIIKFNYPDLFVPEEKDFTCYCAIKLYKGKIINRQEAMKMMEISDETEFDNFCAMFEKQFKKICGTKIADGDFEEKK